MKRVLALLLIICCVLSMSSCSILLDITMGILDEILFPQCEHELSYVPAKEASCTEDGYEEYYVCDICLECFYDSRGLNMLITAPVVREKTGHQFINGACMYCNTVDAGKLPDPNCRHNERTLVPAVPVTCQSEGRIEYYLCVCGAAFADAHSTELVQSVVIAPLPHDYVTGYCTVCGGRDKDYTITSVVANTRPFKNMLSVDGPLTEYALPSVGSPKVLVIPVNLDKANATKKILSDIETAFCGTSEQTGWESVSSYYYKSSYGKLELDFDVVSEWFTPKYSKSYYDSYQGRNGEYGSCLILEEALAYYDGKIDYSDYDSNGDGVIDAVWMIYNCEVDYVNDDTIYWAYMYSVDTKTRYDGVKPVNYGFAGVGFMYDDKTTDDDDVIYDNSKIKIDAHTYIHETGHLMGLDDYYDYDEGSGEGDYSIGFVEFSKELGLWNADMMDSNMGDHCSISKLLLGWINPTTIEGTGTITLSLDSFTEGGGVILVSDHVIETIYDEYFLIEFYTNTGLNENDKPIINQTNADIPVFGIRILHVDARKNYVDGKVEYNVGGSLYPTGFMYDNSDEKYCFVKMLGACGEESEDGYAYEDALFGLGGDVFGVDVYEDYTYHSGEGLNFTLEVIGGNDSETDPGVTVKITVTRFNTEN